MNEATREICAGCVKARATLESMRNCHNCAESPFNGLHYVRHCSHWLKNECSENRNKPNWMKHWRMADNDG